MTPRKPLDEWQAANTPDVLPHHVRRNVTAGEGGCWVWTRSRDRDGYGWASIDHRTYQAHRLVFVLIKGAPPEGLILDHLCRVRHCVNPDHMEPVTPGENLRRSPLTPAGMTYCRLGHPLSNYRKQRRCLICLHAYEERGRRHTLISTECAECGGIFQYLRRRGGARVVCSDDCRSQRRRRQARDHQRRKRVV